jgi:alkyl sulfatase BDS1-like metallo-beta-lactamase superfamily hydrolase
MSDLLSLSARIIDERILDEPANRVTNELSEVADDLAVVESFSNSIVVRTTDGLVAFDTSSALTGGGVVDAISAWADEPFRTLVYTHGHVDHVGGSGHFLATNRRVGASDPRVIGHENVAARFERYRLTNGWNTAINVRQFGPRAVIGGDARFLPEDVMECTDTFSDRSGFRVGDLAVELRHARGETDDHAWAWIPERRAVVAGDFFIWMFPNAGNPQKVQRYPSEWATALREMAALEPELFLPAHGLPIGGAARIAEVLDTVAGVLERLVADVVAAMNAGATLDEILHDVRVDPEVLTLPYLVPNYDEPEFVIHNIWRLYGGWWDGDPSNLKPPRRADLAAEVTSLAGGVEAVVRRAMELADSGDLRLACSLIEMAAVVAGPDPAVHGSRADIYRRRRAEETSLMARGVFGQTMRASADIAPDASEKST